MSPNIIEQHVFIYCSFKNITAAEYLGIPDKQNVKLK